MTLRTKTLRLDAETFDDGLGNVTLVAREVDIEDFEGAVEVVAFKQVAYFIPKGVVGQEDPFTAQDGEPFKIEVWRKGEANPIKFEITEDGKGFILPPLEGVARTLVIKLYPKNRSYVELLFHNGFEFTRIGQ